MTIYLADQMEPHCPRRPPPMEMQVADQADRLVTRGFERMQASMGRKKSM